jgi:hypothetical protein
MPYRMKPTFFKGENDHRVMSKRGKEITLPPEEDVWWGFFWVGASLCIIQQLDPFQRMESIWNGNKFGCSSL